MARIKQTLKPLVNKRYRLERFPGKGGWTFAAIPAVLRDKHKPFGWVKVKGTIDGCEISKCSLMPMGNGKLFLPVKSDIRRKIRKEAGDLVHVILYTDQEPLEIPTEMLECLKYEPTALEFFHSLPESEQNAYIKWIYSAKREETKVDRIAKTVDRLLTGLRLHDKL